MRYLRKFNEDDWNGFSGAGEQAHMGQQGIIYKGTLIDCLAVVDENGIEFYAMLDDEDEDLIYTLGTGTKMAFPKNSNFDTWRKVFESLNEIVHADVLEAFGFTKM